MKQVQKGCFSCKTAKENYKFNPFSSFLCTLQKTTEGMGPNFPSTLHVADLKPQFSFFPELSMQVDQEKCWGLCSGSRLSAGC